MVNFDKIKESLISKKYLENSGISWMIKNISSYNSKPITLNVDWLNNLDFEYEERHTIDLYIGNELIHSFCLSEKLINNTKNFEIYLINIEGEAEMEIQQWILDKKLGY
ncbi:MAG: hypothetical protein WC262_08270 [Bacteroidales bacterium]|jgi:hypothetical protein